MNKMRNKKFSVPSPFLRKLLRNMRKIATKTKAPTTPTTIANDFPVFIFEPSNSARKKNNKEKKKKKKKTLSTYICGRWI